MTNDSTVHHSATEEVVETLKMGVAECWYDQP